MHPITSYLKFLKKATNQHGVHSPFVYQLVTLCLYDKTPKEYYPTLIAYRKALLNYPGNIEVTDFGAGSRVFKSNTRKVSAIAKHAGASEKRAKLLARLAHYFESENILELGTSLGIATAALGSRKGSKVTTLEGCPATQEIAQKQLASFHINRIAFLCENFRESIKKIKNNSFDLIYFDGNHSREATLTYVQNLLPTHHNDSVWIFDDIHWSPEMTTAWEEIKTIPEVTVTVDCYWLGLVFFRKEQKEEHFRIRL